MSDAVCLAPAGLALVPAVYDFVDIGLEQPVADVSKKPLATFVHQECRAAFYVLGQALGVIGFKPRQCLGGPDRALDLPVVDAQCLGDIPVRVPV